MPEIISRKEARERGLKRYFTGRECLNGHVSQHITSNGRCFACWRLWYEANPEYRREKQRLWRLENPEKHQANIARGADKNRVRQGNRSRRMSAALKALEELGIEI